jgi:hypothetical protein
MASPVNGEVTSREGQMPSKQSVPTCLQAAVSSRHGLKAQPDSCVSLFHALQILDFADE